VQISESKDTAFVRVMRAKVYTHKVPLERISGVQLSPGS